MAEFARGVGAQSRDLSETSKSAITNVEFQFSRKICTILITINEDKPRKFTLNYEESNFQAVLEKPLKALGLGLLDLTSLGNLYQIKLVDQLLVKTLKKGMKLIDKFSAQHIYNLANDQTIQALVNAANIEASTILSAVEEKFGKMNHFIENVQMEVYDRSPLIKKAKEELIDNLNRKYILVVNQLIELQRGHTLPESNLSEQVRELIKNL